MDIDWTKINYLAAVVGALATFFLGALWYTVLFGKMWVALQGFTPERVREMQAKRPPPVFFSLLLVCYAVLAIVLAALFHVFHIDTAMTGAALGAVLWLAVSAIQMTGHLSIDRPMGVFLIDAGYQFLYLVMMGAILGAWRVE